MKLDELKEQWDAFGKQDPLWAILVVPDKRHGRWNVASFFKSGEDDIAHILAYLSSLSTCVSRRRALDFGCGVGRLTQALCRYFDECCGVDIAPSMIEAAKRYNRYGTKCSYYVNDTDNLSLFADNSFTFIYSILVLQHMRQRYIEKYVTEFLRVLAPGGIAVFQIASELIAVTATSEAPKASGFRAAVTLARDSIDTMVGHQLALAVRVRNLGDVTWPARSDNNGRYEIRLGNHWLDVNGHLITRDDGRAVLPRDLEPNQEIGVSLTIRTPSEPGSYILELDMVQEAVAWFKDRGSSPTRVPVRAKHSSGGLYAWVQNRYRQIRTCATAGDVRASIDPTMEMYGVEKDVVVGWIGRSGGKVVDVQEDNLARPLWYGYRYCVTK